MTAANARAWLVDLDGTLYRPLPVKLMMGLRLALASPRIRRCVLRFRHEHERLRQDNGDAVESPYALQMERAASDLDLEPGELEPIIDEWMVRRPARWIARSKRQALLEEIDQFRKQGGRTALVSDYPARRKLEALGALALFDVVVANGEAGGPNRLKPNPDGFLLAAEHLGVQPSECLVIGDRDDADGEAARRAGMHFRRIR